MNKQNHEEQNTNSKSEPSPKASVPNSSAANLPTTKSAEGDAVAVSNESANETAKKKRGEMGGIRWTDKLIAAATVVIAMATVIQGYEIVAGSLDTHKLAESSLAASRAWVVVQGTGFGFTKDKDFPTARVILADSGKSPAFGISGWRCVEVRTSEPPMRAQKLEKSTTAICLPISGGVLGAGVPLKMDAFVPAPVPKNFSGDTDGEGAHFYYWGTVTYDIYPSDGRRHSTSFCLKNGGDQLSACGEGGYDAD